MKRLIALLSLALVLAVLPILPPQASAQSASCNGRQVTIDLSRNGGNGNGTPGPDVILGTAGADTIRGFGGADTICAGRGDDVVLGGPGNDVIFGGAGFDNLDGGDGSDTIWGGDNADEIEGGPGNDFLYGQNGWDRISASSGNDTIEGGLGNDWVWAGTGADSLDGGPGDDLLLGFDNNDTITAGGGNDKMNGMNGDDTINAGDGADQIWGGRGDDTIDAGSGFDWVWGNWGSDTINGGHGNDSIFGEGHNDTINGGPGNDTLDGGFDYDICAGNNGNDTATQCESSTDMGSPTAPTGRRIYFNDFSSAGDVNRIDSFVSYRDPFVVNYTTGSSDHASGQGIACSAPEATRTQTRERPQDHVYLCHPGGNSGAGHMMGYAMDTSGYGFVGGLPDQVFEGVQEVSVDINTTSAGWRNFIEIKVLPAYQTYVNALPCGPDIPCHAGWDYDDIGGVGASTSSREGTGLVINTPARPDGYVFGEHAHVGNTNIRERYQHIFRDNGNGTLSFGIREGNRTRWVTAQGSFPDGPVRVVIAFHTYTGLKSDQGPGYDNNVSPSTGGFTWHWDNLAVVADSATPSRTFFGGNSADRIVVPDGCIAFSQGQRDNTHHRDIAPEFRC